ncbi:MAG: undecaprenyldiphospho-muramoylpentapeptide beta-N-acetylglucosaminyltransferase [Deltaproteobacteria bacterium]|nr:undecaprenyldiphospho-muramoylpentapeptide beta-N-acetylglucosaminyltransferase [Candidatus Anaeroferrophillacea bacterium]
MNAERKTVPVIMFAGGGTGGHLFPGIALAAACRERWPEARIVFVGTARGLETRVVPQHGYPLLLVAARGLVGQRWRRRLRGIVDIPRALVQALIHIANQRPQLVVGLGGYASVPTVLAARIGGVPVVLQEQNAFPGVANRVLAPLARAVFIASSEAGKRFFLARTINAGNPVRPDFTTGDVTPVRDRAPWSLLVVGGSQGARSLNDAVPAAVAVMAGTGVIARVVHQAGERDCKTVATAYEQSGVEAEVRPFFDDMPARYAAADLVICRSGALTLAELGLAGRPAVLVPYPHAAHNHQEYNARRQEAAGAAAVIRDDELSGARLAAVLRECLETPGRLGMMATAAAGLARPGAAAEIVTAMARYID